MSQDAGPSFLPQSRTSTSGLSLSSEIEQELGRVEASQGAFANVADETDDDDNTYAYTGHRSILFPKSANTTTKQATAGPNPRRRTTSAASAPDRRRHSTGHEDNEDAGGYGAEDGEEQKSIRIGGSRPPSPGEPLKSRHARQPSTLSFADTDLGASFAGDRTSGLGYLDLQNSANTPERPSTLNHQPKMSTSTPSRAATRRGKVRSGKGLTHPSTSSAGIIGGAPVPHLPESVAGSVYGGTDLQYEEGEGAEREGELSTRLDSHQAWYLLRALVGEEIAYEVDQLWRLTSLDAHERNLGKRRQNGQYENEEDEEHDSISPNEVPILRYLLKHFLLTMPLIRDVGVISSPHSPEGEAPLFWAGGLQVLIRKLHDADLSQPVDQSSKNALDSNQRTPLHNAVERFISAGLKLSNSDSRRGDYKNTVLSPLLGVSPPSMSVRPNSQVTITNNNSHLNASNSTSGNFNPAASTKSSRFSIGTFLPGRSTSSKSPASSPSTSPILPQPNSREPARPNPSKPAPSTSKHGKILSPIPNSPVPDTPQSFVSVDNDDFHGVDSTIPRSASRATGMTSGQEDGASFVSARSQRTKATTIGSPNSYAGDDDRGLGIDDLPPPVPLSGSPWFPWVEGQAIGGQPHQVGLSVNVEPYNVDDNRTPLASPTFQSGDPLSDSGGRRPPPPRTSSRNAIPRVEEAPIQTKKKFGFGSLLRSKKPATTPQGAPPPSPPNSSPEVSPEIPTSRRVPKSPTQEPWVAAMTLPSSAMESRPVSSAPLAVDLIPKSGMSWPFGAPVPFWRGAPYQNLKWGGFEADVVGVRTTLFSHSFIIRVRRPKRLDEYVVRNEAQFMKYYRVLEKQYPAAHIRRVPSSAKDDHIIQAKPPGSPSTTSTQRPVSGAEQSEAGLDTFRSSKSNRSRIATGLKEAAEDPHSSTTPGAEPKRASSPFASKLRAQSIHGDTSVVRARRNTLSGPPRPYSMQSHRSSTGSIPLHLTSNYDLKRLPAHDAQRRALRNWLRDTLSVRTVGHHKETAAFLLLGSILPKDSDFKDIRVREMIDDSRKTTRVSVAQGSAERARTVRAMWAAVEEECIHGDGFVALSEAIRDSATIEKLPARYQKSIECIRLSFAETIYETLVAGPASGSTFTKLKSLHASFPYFLVRQAFKISKPSFMSKVLQDILLARPFGSKSLLQKILAATLEDDPTQTMSAVNTLRSRIASPTMTEKLDIFAYSEREDKQVIRDFARDNNLELVLCIVRSSDEPRLSPAELQRIVQAGKTYRAFLKTRPSALAKAQNSDPAIRLVMDLQLYLRTISRDRDATSIRQMLGDDETAQALEVVAAPFVEFIKRFYKVGNGAQALGDLQKFIDQLIVIIEALRSRVQEPQKSVRIIARLLARHQQSTWDFVRNVHRGETLVEEFLQWGWTASVFLRRGLAQTVDLDSIIPQEEEDIAFFFQELNDLTEYHRKKRTREYQNACRRYAGDVDADDPIVVEGDGRGKSKVEPHLEPKHKRPILREIPYCTEAFRHQLKTVFAV